MDFVRLRWKFETAQQENEQHRAAQDARIAELLGVVKQLLSRPVPPSPASATAARLLRAPAAPSTSRAPNVAVGASPLRRAYTTPAVLKCEDFDVPVTPAGTRAPLYVCLRGLVARTPSLTDVL